MDQFWGDDPLAVESATAAATTPARLVSRAREVPDVSFRAALSAHDGPRTHWTSPTGHEVIGCGAAATLATTGGGRFDEVRAAAADAFDDLDFDGPTAARPRAFGGLAFHAEHEPTTLWRGFQSARFVVPTLQLTRSDRATWATVTATDPATAEWWLDAAVERLSSLPVLEPTAQLPGIAETTRTTTRAEWIENVETARARIQRGDLLKVVLAQAVDVTLDAPIDVPAVLERLRRTYPECYRFMIDPGQGATFFGAPPERLVSLGGRRIETEALAGSIARGETPEADDELVERLRASETFQHEHGLVVDAIRDRLTPRTSAVEVGEQGVRTLATIQHLRTPISATLECDEHVLSIVEALHPTPAVGGLPPSVAMETIRRGETFDRGWYAGPVGWFDAAGDGEFAVGIRSGVAIDDGVTLFAGNGIVEDSDPAEEWEEVRLKFRPILDELERSGPRGEEP